MAETTPKKISDLDALTTPQDTDVMPVVDNSGTPTTKKSTWANIKATLKAYFDPIYESLANKKTTLADNSDTYYPSQKAVKTAVDAKENVANKKTTLADDSDTYYPTQKAVKAAVDGKADKGANSDITSLFGLTTALSVAQGGTGQTTQQAAIDALTNVSEATNEHVLTKDTATGNAIFKAASGGANAALNNLADVAINTSLKSDTDNTDDLGSSAKAWKDLYLKGNISDNTVSQTATRIINRAAPGVIDMFGGSTAPTGSLICDGSAVSRTTYAALFTAIGTTWGVGDNSTTFNLPDMRGVYPKGAGTTNRAAGKDASGNYYAATLGAYATDQLQGHKHNYSDYNTVGVAVDLTTGGSRFGDTPSGVPITDGTNGTPRTGMTTEPQSAAVNFIIWY